MTTFALRADTAGTVRRAIPPCILALCAFAGPALAETRGDDLIGRWRTALVEQPAPDGSASAYVRQTIAFTPDRESLLVEAFADPEAATLLFTYASEGPYRVVGQHPSLDGALALDLENASSVVTIHVDAPELWAAIGLSECPLAIGEAVDIAGCVSGPPFQVTGCVDMDLALVDEDGRRLRMGEGSVDRCTQRPDAPSDTVFTRIE